MSTVVLQPGKARPFFGRHPWVLASAIARLPGDAQPGDVVDLVTDKGQFIARGLVNPRARLCVRLYTWNQAETLDEDFWRRRVEAAIDARAALGRLNRDGACRLIFSEADGLSGLIVDRYGGFLVAQPTGWALAARLDLIVNVLRRKLDIRGVSARPEAAAVKWEGLDPTARLVWGEEPAGSIVIEEHGLRYEVDARAGQKTGFYLDQRENRLAAARWLRGRRVLDLCCFTGGFALNALRHGGAAEVLAVDISEKAVAQARVHAALNEARGLEFRVGDAFRVLDELVGRGEKFDAVILDPPKFAGSRAKLDEALRAYHRLNFQAVNLLTPGGVLVTCSCSGHVSREDFQDVLASVSARAGRDLQIVEQRGAAPDHPVWAACPETAYLKCFICRAL